MTFKHLIIENPTQCPYRVTILNLKPFCSINNIDCSHTAEFPYSCNLDNLEDKQ